MSRLAKLAVALLAVLIVSPLSVARPAVDSLTPRVDSRQTTIERSIAVTALQGARSEAIEGDSVPGPKDDAPAQRTALGNRPAAGEAAGDVTPDVSSARLSSRRTPLVLRI
jgi:hypothetical protein